MRKKAAVLCSLGLGDGVIFSLVAYHLHLHGYDVTTFSEKLRPLQKWFPFQTIVSSCKTEEWQSNIEQYDLVVVQPGAPPYPKFRNLPSPAPRHVHFLYNHEHDHRLTLVENLCHTLKNRFHIPNVCKSNGIVPCPSLQFRKHSLRLAIHPTSGEKFRNYPIQKFVKAARQIKEKWGLQPVFIISEEESRHFLPAWGPLPYPVFVAQSLPDMAAFLYESAYFIGNDSGLGHLSSSLGLPTLTLFYSPAISQFWRPGFAPSRKVLPLPLILRDKWRPKMWKHLLFPVQVARQFQNLVTKSL